jgi:1,2-phenylacetyl-CoA epoxidase PaaB subunit
VNTHAKKNVFLVRRNLRLARSRWRGHLGTALEQALAAWSEELRISIESGDLLLIEGKWYVTHSGLLRLARRKRCCGIHVDMAPEFCDPRSSRWACRATVYKSPTCKGFVGYGDADPSNVDPLVHGAEMRMAETRAVNRALRKAYAVPLCSVEEIGSSAAAPKSDQKSTKTRAHPANGNGYGSRTVRDHLCQLIRQHQLDATLVKSYATDFCGVKSLREASREQVENFVAHLADWAKKDRNALLCQLNSYLGQKAGVA